VKYAECSTKLNAYKVMLNFERGGSGMASLAAHRDLVALSKVHFL
jgi:hypothetical protein